MKEYELREKEYELKELDRLHWLKRYLDMYDRTTGTDSTNVYKFIECQYNIERGVDKINRSINKTKLSDIVKVRPKKNVSYYAEGFEDNINKLWKCNFCGKNSYDEDRLYILPDDDSHGRIENTMGGCEECAAFFDKVAQMLDKP